MIRFLLVGLLRDPARSRFPVTIVLCGVALTVVLVSWVSGISSDLVRTNAAFETGHLKVVTRAYAREADMTPNDLALVGAGALLDTLRAAAPDWTWTPRIRVAGLLDVPDAAGETRAQAPVRGLGLALVGAGAPEPRVLELRRTLARGRLPERPGEMLASEALAHRLGLEPGATATLVATTMDGSLTTWNLRLAGTLRFGIAALDRGTVLLDLADARAALDMDDAAGEIVGFASSGQYDDARARALARALRAAGRAGPADGAPAARRGAADAAADFAPVVLTLREQAGLAQVLDLAATVSGALLVLFLVVMSIVLWNSGLVAGVRRYGEIGLRLALGEGRGHIYGSMLAESLMVGVLGSLAGTALGLVVSYRLEAVGLDLGSVLRHSDMVASSVMRARVTPVSWAVGFLPGVGATVLGTALAWTGVFRRPTSQLTKEFET
jgi:putative ABC transport system permease protein